MPRRRRWRRGRWWGWRRAVVLGGGVANVGSPGREEKKGKMVYQSVKKLGFTCSEVARFKCDTLLTLVGVWLVTFKQVLKNLSKLCNTVTWSWLIVISLQVNFMRFPSCLTAQWASKFQQNCTPCPSHFPNQRTPQLMSIRRPVAPDWNWLEQVPENQIIEFDEIAPFRYYFEIVGAWGPLYLRGDRS